MFYAFFRGKVGLGENHAGEPGDPEHPDGTDGARPVAHHEAGQPQRGERHEDEHPDDEHHGKFARLTVQEEKNGLLDDPSGIGTREGWARRLAERGFALKGHRLVRKSADGNRVGEIPHGVHEIRTQPPQRRGADHDVVVAAELMKQQSECGHQHGEQGGALAPCQVLQFPAQFFGNGQIPRGAGAPLVGWPREIER